MKNSLVIIFLMVMLATAFYLLGKKNGAGQTKTDIVQNVALVKEIAQLASLQVNGFTNIKISNKTADAGVMDKLKNYFSENTLQVSLPFEAKYGVDMSNQKMNIDTKAGTATIYLPTCKLMSIQLRLDKLESMSQTGIFSTISIDDFVKAQKQMYASATSNLENNNGYIKLAEDNIRNTLSKYYLPLGYKIICVFGDKAAVKL
jgi:hypothetical protein